MLVAVSSQGDNLDALVDPRFGRASTFLVVDTLTMAFEVIENTQNLDLSQGAGIQAAQNIAGHNPAAVLTGNCGPKAFRVLKAAGIDVLIGVKGAIRDAVQSYMEGKHEPTKDANVEGHWM
ncbi:NifB/NifX family molybdenum-iron cluster-binding protein [Thermodesulfobacteriota bacterium]